MPKPTRRARPSDAQPRQKEFPEWFRKRPGAPESGHHAMRPPPTTFVARLNQEIAVERLVTTHGVELRRDGAQIRGVCPFHPDDGRSLVIDSKRNTWRCESGCAEGGSAVEWVQKARGISRHRAAGCASVEHLAEIPRATKALATLPHYLSLGSGIPPMFA